MDFQLFKHAIMHFKSFLNHEKVFQNVSTCDTLGTLITIFFVNFFILDLDEKMGEINLKIDCKIELSTKVEGIFILI